MIKSLYLATALAVVLLPATMLPHMLHAAPRGSATHGTPADPVAIAAGQATFQNNCLPCHSTNQGQVGIGPSLYHVLARPHPLKTPDEVRALLKNGKGKMPSFEGRLSPADVNNLIAYLHTV